MKRSEIFLFVSLFFFQAVVIAAIIESERERKACESKIREMTVNGAQRPLPN